jgi:uncharacterized protein
VSFLLQPTERYDQAGLVLSLRSPGASRPLPGDSPAKWVKSGIEYYQDVPRAATVGTDTWSDWSLAEVKGKQGDWFTLLAQAETDELGNSLWIYQVVDGEKIPMREVTWVYGLGDADKWELTVEAYACRPAKEAGDLVVQFKDFDVQWA